MIKIQYDGSGDSWKVVSDTGKSYLAVGTREYDPDNFIYVVSDGEYTHKIRVPKIADESQRTIPQYGEAQDIINAFEKAKNTAQYE